MSRLSFVFTSVLAAALLTTSCANEPPPLTLEVDANVQPFAAVTPGWGGGAGRPVASLATSDGKRADFVADEVMLLSNDATEVDGLVTRWNGTVLRTVDFGAAGLIDVPNLHVIRIDPSAADPKQLPTYLRTNNENFFGEFRVSSEAALKLLTACAREGTEEGLTVSPNWMLERSSIETGTAREHASSSAAGYSPDAESWPYMNQGSAQDIGVVAAWRALLAAGRLDNRVKIGILDAGFIPNADIPSGATITGSGAWNRPNTAGCGGSDCPWHGTSVVASAMARPDNSFGVAGPAGPIGQLAAIQSPSADLLQVLEYIAYAMIELVSADMRVINMSGAVEVPAILAAFTDRITDPIGLALTAADISIYAAAGNDGNNVDAEDCLFDLCWEESTHLPCETTGVTCIGGMAWNSTARDPSSNYGTKTGANSVDIYGPFEIWGPVDPDTAFGVARIRGTSFASPFVAGIGALIRATDPSLSAFEVESLLLGTAHVGGVHSEGGHQRRVNALAAVRQALGGSIPPYIRITAPYDGYTYQAGWSLGLNATSYAVDGATPAIVWQSDRDGMIGTGATGSIASSLSVGTHRITASATADGQSVSDSVLVTIVNTAPSVSILEPADGDERCVGENIHFYAAARDPGFPSGFPSANLSWSSMPVGVSGTGELRVALLPTGNYSATVTADDGSGGIANAGVSFTVARCPSLPPEVSITSHSNMEVYGNGADANGLYYELTLVGSATDPEDGVLSGSSLVWTTDRADLQPGGSALLGTGRSITVRLYTDCAKQTHDVTLTATDSDGNVRRAVIRIGIGYIC